MPRPKGTPNKVSGEVRESILESFRRLGGVPKMVEWAQASEENLAKFYTQIFPKAIQQNVAVNVHHQVVERNYTGRITAQTLIDEALPMLIQEAQIIDPDD
jgi:hypothetical protein